MTPPAPTAPLDLPLATTPVVVPRSPIPVDRPLDPRALVEPPWAPPIERIAPRLARLLSRRPLRFADATARLSAYVYGNLVVLAALLALSPSDAVSRRGAIAVLAAGASTFVAHSFADLLAHRVGHGHRSVVHAALHAARTSLPIATSALAPVAALACGDLLGWSDPVSAAIAELLVCSRIGLVGAAAERFRGVPSSRRVVVVGIMIGVAAGMVAVAKTVIAGG
ncbi:hypothetical protein [Frondihabitans australicus]|uniref:Uncharacterized protein n=1 Tax=Frondihabitans australicus TaxID=386892 RepID=A0A495IIK0_9MICO|nr:hypothetical protein [Frondihabitans australicus]RKR75121.1 hypothetical protein C8E83_2258 [Frondihabitans australicus]